jgi:hypothetical protein
MLFYRKAYEDLYKSAKKQWWEYYQLVLVKRARDKGVKMCCYHSEPIYEDPPMTVDQLYPL